MIYIMTKFNLVFLAFASATGISRLEQVLAGVDNGDIFNTGQARDGPKSVYYSWDGFLDAVKGVCNTLECRSLTNPMEPCATAETDAASERVYDGQCNSGGPDKTCAWRYGLYCGRYAARRSNLVGTSKCLQNCLGMILAILGVFRISSKLVIFEVEIEGFGVLLLYFGLSRRRPLLQVRPR